MTLTELQYIVALAQTGHFGKAAERCFVSQPTLSIAIKKLEDELAVCLFERSRNQVRTTELGEQIIQQARYVLEQADAIKTMASAGENQLSTPLKVGAIYTIGPYLFPHLVPRLREMAPEMPLYIEENYTAVLTEKLRQGELDAIVISLPFEHTDIITRPLYDETFTVLMPNQHKLAKKKLISPNNLDPSELLLLGKGHCFRDQIINLCPQLADEQQHKPTTVEGTSLETLRHMVASGLGVTILPDSASGASLYSSDSLVARSFQRPTPKRTVALAWRVTFPRIKAIDCLLQATNMCSLTQ